MVDANIPTAPRKRARLEVRPSHERKQSSTPHTDTQEKTIASLTKQLEEQRQQNQTHAETIAHLAAKMIGLEKEVHCERKERYRLVEKHNTLRHKMEDELYGRRRELSAHVGEMDNPEGKLQRKRTKIKNLQEQIAGFERKLDYETFECKREEIKHEGEIVHLEIELEKMREGCRRTKDELEWERKFKMGR